jgi:hypothetical protein
MKFIFLFAMLMACSPTPKIDIKPGECVLGTGMAMWKLLRTENEDYLFAQFPLVEGAKVHVVKDLSAVKKVECPH